MKEGRDLIKEALADAKSLKEAAVESAKKEIIEDLAPAVRKLLEQKLNERSRTQGLDNVRDQKQDYDGNKIKATDENADPVTEDLTLEDALQEFFPAEAVEEKKDMDKKSSKKSSKKNEALETEAKSSKKSEVNEEIEISEAELRKVYEAALQTEVSVKKGFSDIVGGGELDQAHKETGILDKEGGEKTFDKKEPPHTQKWIPEAKELHAMLQRGLAENKALRENLRKAAAMIETLGKKLHEVNLFNAKVLHVNKILNNGVRLTKEQKEFVMNTIDKSRSISEVKMNYETLQGSFKMSAAVNESRRPLPNAAKPRTTGTPKQEVLSESVDRGEKAQYSRIQELAGLLK